jgi:hypothetical protein
MKLINWRNVALISGALISSHAGAQTAPTVRTVPVTFTGVVSSTAADTMMVRQPDGTMTKFQGDLPSLPYAKGDAVTISFKADLPTRAFYDSPAYLGQKAVDGIYRIRVANPASISFSSVGGSTIADVSGPINPAPNDGQPTNTMMTLVYDYNKDSYSIEGGGNFFSGAYTSPGYIYDAASKTYVACGGGRSCYAPGGFDTVLTGISAGQGNDASTVRSGNISITSTDPSSGTGTGFFS